MVGMRAREPGNRLCPVCGLVCPGYDGGWTKRWRALDWGRCQVFIEAVVWRVRCPDHGVHAAAVPWARPRARHTRAFEQEAAWCATEMSASAATKLLRCSWRTIGAMTRRVLADLETGSGSDGLDRLTRIGIDEISYRRGHTYLVVVTDHDTRRLVWARPGRDRATVDSFFAQLGPERTRALTHVSSDSARWISGPVAVNAPHVIHCADPFHIVKWAGEALNLLRRKVWNDVRRRPGRNRPAIGEGKLVNKTTWALRKDPAAWTPNQQAAMAWVQATHPDLHRAWQLKEALRAVFSLAGVHAIALLDEWLVMARSSGLEEMTAVAAKITTHRTAIENSLMAGLTNALTEALNTRIRLITRRAYGFKDVHALIALAKLSIGLHKPLLPT